MSISNVFPNQIVTLLFHVKNTMTPI